MNASKFEFENDNHYNLFMLAQAQRLVISDEPSFAIENQDWCDRYKVSLDAHTWYIKTDLLPKFWLILSNEKYSEMAEIVTQPNKEMTYRPSIPKEMIDTSFDETDEFYKLTGEDYNRIDIRMSGLITASSSVIREIAGLVNAEMDAIAADVEVVKDFDGILTFDSKPGTDFKVGLCFDKVKPIAEGNSDVFIDRTPITQEDLKTYLPKNGEKIVSRLNYINTLVTDFLASKAVSKNDLLTKYAGMAIDVVLLHAFLNQTVTYISFGGSDNWSSNGKETPNNAECFKYLDAELENLIKLLESIPKSEGVDLYSIDVDTFTIFGRTDDNKVVTPALQGYTNDILDRYSKGFERTLAIRMSMVDNPHFFRA